MERQESTKIKDGATIIYNEDVSVRNKMETIGGFSLKNT